jgi:hypothetical protein
MGTTSSPARPTHPVELLAAAIATQEGNPGSNPGNLRYAGQLNAKCSRCGAAGGKVPITCSGKPVHGIAEFSSRGAGVAGLFRQLWLQVAEGQTVEQIIAQWAPPNENNTSVYLANVLNWTGLPEGAPVLSLLPALFKMNG